MRDTKSREQRLALLTEWKNRLGLEKWTITALLNCGPSEINERFAGEAEYQSSIRSGSIRVLAQKYHEDEDDYDFEQTLVHELLHLKLGIFWDNAQGIAQDLLHQTIEELAIALVDAKRNALKTK